MTTTFDTGFVLWILSEIFIMWFFPVCVLTEDNRWPWREALLWPVHLARLTLDPITGEGV